MTLPVAIIAGGLATRLYPISHTIPKSLIDVAGKPFAQHQLELLKHHGYEEIVFCLGHLGNQIEASFGDGRDYDLHICYSYDGEELVGTGGAIRKALPLLGEKFFVMYGDSYLECDYKKIEEAFINSNKSGLMTIYKNYGQYDSSNIEYKDGMIVRYDKKNVTPAMQYIDFGLSALDSKVFSESSNDKTFGLEIVFQRLIARQQMAAFVVKNRFYEIGSISGLEETRTYLSTHNYGT